MGVSVFVYGPVTVLAILSLLAIMGLGNVSGTMGDINFDSYTSPPIYYTADGSPKCYSNFTIISEPGRVVSTQLTGDLAMWANGTAFYQLYADPTHETPLRISQVGTTLTGRPFSNSGFSASLGSTLGLIAVISGIIAVGVIASVKIFGFGLSDVGINTLMKGSAYIIVWAVFSGLSMSLIVAGADFYTPIIYLGLTGCYAFGVMGEVGTPSSG